VPAAVPQAAVPAPRLALAGELTIQTAADRRATLLAALEAATTSPATEIELDLSEVSELDTAGLQVLLVAQREAAALGRTLRVVGAGSPVTDVLAIAHLTTELTPAGVAVPKESVR
jgi:anti-anti-sigma factor